MDERIYGEHYSPAHILSYHRPLNISIGARGIGKSTGVGLKYIGDVYEKHRLFIYTRRTVDETEATAESFFYSPLKIYNDWYNTKHEFNLKSIKTGEYVDENGNTVGYAVPLSQADKRKSTPYGAIGVRNILYDEAILRRGKEAAYLGTKTTPLLEYELLTGLYTTVDRSIGKSALNDTQIFVCGNFANLYNPILMGINAEKYVTINSKTVAPKGKPWVVELTDKVAATEDMKKSFGYQLSTEATKANDYDNDGFLHCDNVKKLKGVMNPLINVIYHGRKYGIFMCEKEGIIYVNDHPSKSGVREISLTMADGKINQVVAVKYNKCEAMMLLRKFTEMGLVIFATETTRNDILTYLNFTI